MISSPYSGCRNFRLPCDVRNVSSRGYLGGLEANFDNTGSNGDARGMTLGRSVGTGAADGASASYAGVGGADAGTTNATYGSITAPFDLGSVSLMLGDEKRAVDLLEEAFRQRSSGMIYLRDAKLPNGHNSPQFDQLIEKMHFAG